ncbi:MAG: bifunctional (p)ppGpp synthetase/guanosine-3',5'-bis(diphosphate) 3'-pyrophosphohydrolase [Oscillospiraceae bacterium]|jgi:GTP pyrophosphokinase|nr:bifunctional (p)ppGpp synthetase/guanosine-3',5'-bis(diphosphate) 3'-pyrophosphohydrolase [Oscillospiraceae bacterium]
MVSAQPVIGLDELLVKLSKYHPDADLKLVEKAYRFSQIVHEGQVRKSGEPYFSHPGTVADILADLMMDSPTIVAGLLHDTVEDCERVTQQTIEKEFTPEVAQLVDGVTKLGKLEFTSREEQQSESLRKMILAMSKDIRVVLIKLADRLHNMRTLKYQPPERQQAIARETLDIYAPLAHRLGVYKIKQELEDLCLRYLDPEEYQSLIQKVGMRWAERNESIRLVVQQLGKKIEELGIRYDIDGRPKHFYSIYKKMVLQNKPFEQIYDLIAIRVLVDTVPDCYAVLGIVHTLWKQVPNRFKDYISIPKPNMYQSLHTTVVGQNGMPFEVQIRTWEMHRMAEFGIAAHWRYKEGKQTGDELDKKLHWLRQIMDWQNETHDSKEFVDSLKVDLFNEEVFVFTPKGDILDLPRGATPIDFAYRIHSGVGNKCVGAKVNGRIVPIDTELKTGDFVEIITQNNAKGPSMDWLKIVKTSQAKAKIRSFFKRELKEENVAKGRSMLEHEAKRMATTLPSLLKNEYIEPILKKYAFDDVDDIYAGVGFGALAASHIVARLLQEQRARERPASPKLPDAAVPDTAALPRPQAHSDQGIFVRGEPGMLVRFAKCCSPLPGDEIVGYITRGRGVTVHKADCINMLSEIDADRLVQVSWDAQAKSQYSGTIHIIAYDRQGLLADLVLAIGGMKVTITAVSARANKKNDTCNLTVTLEVENVQEMDRVIRQLAKRSDIVEIYRLST